MALASILKDAEWPKETPTEDFKARKLRNHEQRLRREALTKAGVIIELAEKIWLQDLGLPESERVFEDFKSVIEHAKEMHALAEEVEGDCLCEAEGMTEVMEKLTKDEETT